MSHPVGAGAGSGGSQGAHPIDDKHRRRGGWWVWLAALLVLLLLALLVVLLVRHFSNNDKTTSAKKPLTTSSPAPSTIASSPLPASSSAPAPSATAVGPAIAAASCIKPSLTVTPRTVQAGQTVTVIGRHFSGCRASTGNATPAANLPVAVGLTGQTTVAHALATAHTNKSGYFKVTLTIPPGLASGTKTVTLAGASKDTGTTLAYAGATTVPYTIPNTNSSGGSGAGAGGGMPTGVPAGTGGQAAATSNSEQDLQLAVLAGGLLIAVSGASVLARRRNARRFP